MTSTPQATRIAAFTHAPVSARKIAAGTHTRNAPAIGIMDRKNITTPQSSGDGQAEDPEDERAERSLDRGNHQDAVDRGRDHLARAERDVVGLHALDRQHLVGRLADPLAVAEQVEQREHDEHHLHDGADRAADDDERAARQHRAPRLHALDRRTAAPPRGSMWMYWPTQSIEQPSQRHAAERKFVQPACSCVAAPLSSRTTAMVMNVTGSRMNTMTSSVDSAAASDGRP